jgi:choice-of-anchor C domain-containing protein
MRTNRSRTILWAMALLLLACSPGTTRAELIINGSFELPVVGPGFAQRNPGDNFGGNGWVVGSGPIDHIGSLWVGAMGPQSLDLNANVAGGVYQDLATVAGATYTIRFAMSGNHGGFGDKRMEVLWDGMQIADVTHVWSPSYTSTNMGWTYFQLTAVAQDTSTRLTFNSLTGAMNGVLGFNAFYGPALDDVSVTEANPSAIPEPGTLVLLGSAGVTLIGYRWRRGRR